MKKLYFLFLLFFATNTFANPITLPECKISEIYFNELGEWVIELNKNYFYEDFDSIKIESNAGIARLISIDTSHYLPIFTKENLDNPISISKDGDYIKIYVFNHNYGLHTNYIAIGNHSDSYLQNIKNGQSVSSISGFSGFVKSRPSIGEENSFDYAIVGNIYGYFYDVNRELIKNHYLLIYEGNPEKIKIDDNGFYSINLISKEYSLSNLYLSQHEYTSRSYSIEPLHLNIQEGDSINIDFRLTQELSSLKNVDEQTAVLLSNYPNPAKDYTYFIFDERLLNKGCSINIHDINGKLVFSFKPNSSTHYFDCSRLHKGMYIYTLSIDNEIIAKNKLIIAE